MPSNKPTNSVSNKVRLTEPYIPKVEKYMHYVEQAFNNKWLTNNGPLLSELTERLKQHLGVEHLLLVNNGTSALQLAYQVKDLTGKSAITSPFTFPATFTAMAWQNINAQFADIDVNSWNLCPNSVDAMLQRQQADAIVPVNIFGAPCDMAAFDRLGEKYQVPVIYDSAQALLTEYQGQSVFKYGDIHCISFHATKLFHCVEGGALVFKHKRDLERARKLINFGFDGHGTISEPGINAKMSELHAAMGLCALDELEQQITAREAAIKLYKQHLSTELTYQTTDYPSYIPPMYMPVKLNSECQLLTIIEQLKAQGIESRRYFYPPDSQFLANTSLANCDAIADKVLCLPLMAQLQPEQIITISQVINKNIG